MKVHFAGYVAYTDSLNKAGINYVLDTFYELKNLNGKKLFDHVGHLNSKKHSIIDSGLFTLMFGAKAGTKLDEDFIYKWQDAYANLVNSTGFKHSIVECDVQKKIGPEFAWEMRRKFKTQVKNTIINVYHIEDENPDKLIDFADYIAVSIPELRFCCSRKERYRITEYISSKAMRKGKRVHLLGCTEKEMLKRFSYCFSCDSTSWISGGRYGNHKTDSSDTEITIKAMKRNELPFFKAPSHSWAFYQAITRLDDYKKYAGDQS